MHYINVFYFIRQTIFRKTFNDKCLQMNGINKLSIGAKLKKLPI